MLEIAFDLTLVFYQSSITTISGRTGNAESALGSISQDENFVNEMLVKQKPQPLVSVL